MPCEISNTHESNTSLQTEKAKAAKTVRCSESTCLGSSSTSRWMISCSSVSMAREDFQCQPEQLRMRQAAALASRGRNVLLSPRASLYAVPRITLLHIRSAFKARLELCEVP
ncbi:uncharacterized protein SS50377_28839 [Spironucleus salmonicida]|uniref:Uncharacterized protein n=1 Tax=Spironucleus salmonicida TaxID=348837 RepID=A0A9P8LIR8_9EUKA|nr:hypothetical protein SS50377_28839 [Spironucleus salmonicida]